MGRKIKNTVNKRKNVKAFLSTPRRCGPVYRSKATDILSMQIHILTPCSAPFMLLVLSNFKTNDQKYLLKENMYQVEYNEFCYKSETASKR
jgi:hypothetical protein